MDGQQVHIFFESVYLELFIVIYFAENMASKYQQDNVLYETITKLYIF